MTRQDAVKIALAPVGAAALVAAATAVGRALGVDLTAAALLLLLVVLVATLVGRMAGAVATVLGFLALNYYFTDPRESLDVNKGDDLVALAAFAVASGVLGWTITRLSQLRDEAERRRRESQIRLDLTSRILAGEDPDTVLAGAADALLTLFDLVECTVRRRAAGHRADGRARGRARADGARPFRQRPRAGRGARGRARRRRRPHPPRG